MSVLFNCQNLSKSYASRSLFENLSLTISDGDRIGLIGLNGCGKSTFLKILAGLEVPDEGALSPRRGIRVGYVPQTCEFEKISPLQVLIDAVKEYAEEHEWERLAKMQLQKLGFSANEECASKLSGGWKKRLRIAKELITNPDILLLDEPTNHLDLEGILWLEKFLKEEAMTYLLVSHDRYFLDKAVNRIFEIDKVYPTGVFAIDGTYSEFLHQKDLFVKGQIEQEKRVAGKLRRETEWLRAGVKARTTKAQSRIDEAGRIKEEHAELSRRNKQKTAKIDFSTTERETRKLLVATNIAKKYGDKDLFSKLDFTLSPKARLGLMGPNGCGKTTLLKMLADEEKPDEGTIKRADDLKVVYFDQHRMKLPLDSTLKEALAPGRDFVIFRGQKIHINGWCQRFLFSPDLLGIPLGKLSGGERARITIAHLMLQPADVLLLDEPTNDLDIPTLETLEESLLDFPGAIVLISHDRCMLDKICNQVLALGDSKKTEMFADYNQWQTAQSNAPKKEKIKVKVKVKEPSKPNISYTKKKELERIERKITKLEEKLQEQNKLLEDESIANDAKKCTDICEKIKLLENEISDLYVLWEEGAF